MNPHTIDKMKLPEQWPTQMHDAKFWEHLGRAVATFGFLENVLKRAIFAFTGMQECSGNDDEQKQAMTDWEKKLVKTLSDPLATLIDTYGKAVRDYPDAKIDGFDDLIKDLRTLALVRNVLCHGAWMNSPDESGATIPAFVRKQEPQIWDTPVDIAYLQNTQKHTTRLAQEVMETVTERGWKFPGTGTKQHPITE